MAEFWNESQILRTTSAVYNLPDVNFVAFRVSFNDVSYLNVVSEFGH